MLIGPLPQWRSRRRSSGEPSRLRWRRTLTSGLGWRDDARTAQALVTAHRLGASATRSEAWSVAERSPGLARRQGARAGPGRFRYTHSAVLQSARTTAHVGGAWCDGTRARSRLQTARGTASRTDPRRSTRRWRASSDRVAQSTEQVLQEQRLCVRRLRVPHVGVPRASAIEIVVPAHGVMGAVGPPLVTCLVDLDQHMDGRIDRLEVVEFVITAEASGQAFRRYVRRIEHPVAARAHVGIVGMAVEVRAGQSAVPRPVVLGVRGGVHADVAAARLDVAFEDVLLRG